VGVSYRVMGHILTFVREFVVVFAVSLSVSVLVFSILPRYLKSRFAKLRDVKPWSLEEVIGWSLLFSLLYVAFDTFFPSP